MPNWSEISKKKIYYLKARCSRSYCHFLDLSLLYTHLSFFTAPISKALHITSISNGKWSLCMICFKRPSTRPSSLQMMCFIWLRLLERASLQTAKCISLSTADVQRPHPKLTCRSAAAAEEDINNDVIYYWSTSSSRSSNVRAVNCALIRLWHVASRHVANRRTNLLALPMHIFAHRRRPVYLSPISRHVRG